MHGGWGIKKEASTKKGKDRNKEDIDEKKGQNITKKESDLIAFLSVPNHCFEPRRNTIPSLILSVTFFRKIAMLIYDGPEAPMIAVIQSIVLLERR